MVVALIALFAALAGGAFAASKLAHHKAATPVAYKPHHHHHGHAGPAGPAGAQGPRGETGAAGAQGTAGQRGATGAAGVDGATGMQGVAGTARAYAVVGRGNTCAAAAPHACPFARNNSAVTAVRLVGPGEFCVTVSGVSADDFPAVVAPESNNTTAGNQGITTVQTNVEHPDCPGGIIADEFEVKTYHLADVANTVVAVADNDAGFTFIVP
jgi:hypothetical protein